MTTQFYRIIDLQGGGLRAGVKYNTVEEVRASLASFHEIDVEGAMSMTLPDLCEIGTWEVEEVQIKDGVETSKSIYGAD